MRPARRACTAAGVVLLAISGCASQPRPLADFAAEGLPPAAELTDTPFFPQRELQCGPAALATVLVASGVEASPDALAAEVYLPGRKGSLQVEMIAAARSRGRLPYVVAPGLEYLLAEVAAGNPVLVLQKTGAGPWPGWHYAVVVGYDLERDRLLLRSGTDRRLEVSSRLFRMSWQRADQWALLLLEPGDLPARPDFARYLQAAGGLEAVGRVDEAERAYRAATQYWPARSLPWVALANVALARGDLPTAERNLREALRLEPTDVVARNNLTEVLATMGCPASARREFAAMPALAGDDPLAPAIESTARRVAGEGGSDAPGCPSAAATANSLP